MAKVIKKISKKLEHKHKLKIVYEPITKLKAWRLNPRKGLDEAAEKVCGLMDRFGFVNPIIATPDGIIRAGHTRMLAAIKAGFTEVPVIYVPFGSEQEAALYAVADNKSGEWTTWNKEKLASILVVPEARLESTSKGSGFSQVEIEGLRSAIARDAEKESDEDIAAAEEASFGVFNKELVLAEAFKHYRKIGFPYKQLPVHLMMAEINKLAATPEESLLRTNVGYDVADVFHPHRFELTVGGKMSLVEGFNSDKTLKRALSLHVGWRQAFSGTGFIPELKIVTGVQACANFRPGAAMYFYRRFCGPNAVVLDSSSGFGGRLIGYIASRLKGKYIGVDPSKKTYQGNMKILKTFGFEQYAELIMLPAEDVPHERVANKCDFAFTSPPYFTKEHYAEESTQSWKRYPEGEAWRVGFLVPMLKLQYVALKHLKYNVVNIADVKIGKEKYPLVQWTIDAGKEVGFDFIEHEKLPLPNMPEKGQNQTIPKTESVLIFQKRTSAANRVVFKKTLKK